MNSKNPDKDNKICKDLVKKHKVALKTSSLDAKQDYIKTFFITLERVYSINPRFIQQIKEESEKYHKVNIPEAREEFEQYFDSYEKGINNDPAFAYFMLEFYKRQFYEEKIDKFSIENYMIMDTLDYLQRLTYIITSPKKSSYDENAVELTEGRIPNLYALKKKEKNYLVVPLRKVKEGTHTIEFLRRTQEFGILKRFSEKYRGWSYSDKPLELKLSFKELIEVLSNEKYCSSKPDFVEDYDKDKRYAKEYQLNLIKDLRKNIRFRIPFLKAHLPVPQYDELYSIGYLVLSLR